MASVGMGNGDLMAKVGIEAMKKAMQVQEKEVLSVLQGAVPASNLLPPPPQIRQDIVSEMTGVGQKIDIKS